MSDVHEVLPMSFYDKKQTVTISYRGRLAEKASAINCTQGRESLLNELITSQFAGCLCFWDSENKLVIGLVEDVGLYYPHW